tara:strand:- start:1921 stop:2061 length:141 start_codon:yes stop_codon:yes gene_type:complete
MTLSHSHTCLRADAYAFKRAAPFSYTDQTGWCYLLQALQKNSNKRP